MCKKCIRRDANTGKCAEQPVNPPRANRLRVIPLMVLGVMIACRRAGGAASNERRKEAMMLRGGTP